MGRIEKSQGLAPPAIRKDTRAKQARQIINKTVPALLASSTRAKKGSESSELIVDPVAQVTASDKLETPGGDVKDAAYVKRKGQGRRKVKIDRNDEPSGKSKERRERGQDSINEDLTNLTISPTPPSPSIQSAIRIISTDTLTATHLLTASSKPQRKSQNICILNMASPLRPGGGVLTGATSQEEFLCARTTLLPSLKESFYRLPELGGIWSPDVLVFRTAAPLGDAQGELGLANRIWVDVISAGMLRFPELEGGEDEVKRLGKRDRALVEGKMRAVLRIAAQKGVKKLVLGAWGCGAYGNPVVDIAEAWRRVLDGRNGKEKWPSFEEVVFAISNRKMAADFASAFDTHMEVERGPGDDAEEVDGDEEDTVAGELRTKIAEMEGQISKVWNVDLKARMDAILDGLRAQLRERVGGAPGSDTDEEEGREGGVTIGDRFHGYEDDNEEEDEEEESSEKEDEYVKE